MYKFVLWNTGHENPEISQAYNYTKMKVLHPLIEAALSGTWRTQSSTEILHHHPCNASIKCYISWHTAVVQSIRITDQQEAQVLVV